MSGKFYITTSIAYTNAPPHVGFALELAQADVLARWHGLKGDKRFFLTGTDEHGRKVAKAAAEVGKEPRTFVDETSEKFRKLTEILQISNDDFIRTSDTKRHWPGVSEMWKRLTDAGDLYKGTYTGLYCEGCEAFKKPSDLKDGECPDHNREPEKIEEENWFFRLSKYAADLTRIIGGNEIHIIPETRKNEVLSFIAQGLEDVSFSRPRKDLSWGIPVPGDDTQTIYVWADALTNYLSALGFGRSADQQISRLAHPLEENSSLPVDKSANPSALFERFWPADVHVIGKDILRFHAVIWPAMLLSAKLSLPKQILVHGHIRSAGQKMSKSLGNVMNPFVFIEEFGSDALRYFLLREIPTTGDGDFTPERFREVYNADLVHTLGNLVSRVTKLAEGKVVTPSAGEDVREVVRRAWLDYENELEAFAFDGAVGKVMALANFANEFIERTKPWAGEMNAEGALPQLAFMLGNIAWMLAPILPETARNMFGQLGIEPSDRFTWERQPVTMKKGDSLFPKR